MTRSEALALINEGERGLHAIVSDSEMVPYQNDVSQVYGAYEGREFQKATVLHLISLAKRLMDGGIFVSLGCGPASYEIWLLSQTKNLRAVLVDHSPGMLTRAKAIAERIGVARRITFVESDSSNVSSVSSSSAQLVLCLNSMHWSEHWRQWIAEVSRIARSKAFVLVTCSFFMPRSKISSDSFGEAMSRSFQNQGAGWLIRPADMGGEMVAINGRFYAMGRKK